MTNVRQLRRREAIAVLGGLGLAAPPDRASAPCSRRRPPTPPPAP